jgi:DUF1365 family protein
MSTATTSHSAIYEGRVRHHRHRPKVSRFEYTMFMVYLDLDELDEVFRGSWLWSTRRPAPAWFRRQDHHGDVDLSLEEATRRLVDERLGFRPAGPIRLLTHLRYWGYVMNPVSFYWCWSEDGASVEAIVAEVHNTPWGERHCYVFDVRDASAPWRFDFDKSFHVSPFMPMEQQYDWRFDIPDESIAVHMVSRESGDVMFDATLDLERRAMTSGVLRSVLARYPVMTMKVVWGIYWQAFRLWLRRIPFHSHPRKIKRKTAP